MEARPGAMEAGPEAMESGPGAMEAGPGAMEAGPEAVESGPGAMEAGPGAMEAGPEAMVVLHLQIVVSWGSIFATRLIFSDRWFRPIARYTANLTGKRSEILEIC